MLAAAALTVLSSCVQCNLSVYVHACDTWLRERSDCPCLSNLALRDSVRTRLVGISSALHAACLPRLAAWTSDYIIMAAAGSVEQDPLCTDAATSRHNEKPARSRKQHAWIQETRDVVDIIQSEGDDAADLRSEMFNQEVRASKAVQLMDNALENSGRPTLASLAARLNKPARLATLRECGAGNQRSDTVGLAPQHYAARFGHAEALKMLQEWQPIKSSLQADGERQTLFDPELVDRYGRTATSFAIAHDYADLVRQLGPVSLRGNDTLLSTSNLHTAVALGRVPVVQVLAEHWQGQDTPEARQQVAADRLGRTPSHMAALARPVRSQGAQLQACWDGLQACAEMERRDEAGPDGQSPLHFAALANNAAAIAGLFKQRPELLVQRDDHGNTALHLAAQYGHVASLQALCESRKTAQSSADAEVTQAEQEAQAAQDALQNVESALQTAQTARIAAEDQWSAADSAAEPAQREVTASEERVAAASEALAAAQAQAEEADARVQAAATDDPAAAQQAKADAAQAVTDATAALNAAQATVQAANNTLVPLRQTADGRRANFEAAQIAEKQQEEHVSNAKTALDSANAKLQAAREHKADCDGLMDAKNVQGSTALHAAALARSSFAAQFLLDQLGANPNVQDKHGRTALHIACSVAYASAEIADLLVSKAASLELADVGGNLPLHEAAATGLVNLVSLALGSAGTLACTANAAGYLPLHCAVMPKDVVIRDTAQLPAMGGGLDAVIYHLVSAGADVHAVAAGSGSFRNVTALDIVAQQLAEGRDEEQRLLQLAALLNAGACVLHEYGHDDAPPCMEPDEVRRVTKRSELLLGKLREVPTREVPDHDDDAF